MLFSVNWEILIEGLDEYGSFSGGISNGGLFIKGPLGYLIDWVSYLVTMVIALGKFKTFLTSITMRFFKANNIPQYYLSFSSIEVAVSLEFLKFFSHAQ